MHSFVSRVPRPRPRAAGSTNRRRRRATLLESFTRNTDPTFWPSISAIQQRSHFGSYLLTKSATICAHSPSKFSAQFGVPGNYPAEITGSWLAEEHVALRFWL